VIRWLIWIGFVVAWTIALEVPAPETEGLPGGEMIDSNRRLIAKSAHVAVYVVMAMLSGWVPIALRYRWVMMFFLMGHAWGTEYLQELLQSVCFRGFTNYARLKYANAVAWARVRASSSRMVSACSG